MTSRDAVIWSHYGKGICLFLCLDDHMIDEDFFFNIIKISTSELLGVI